MFYHSVLTDKTLSADVTGEGLLSSVQTHVSSEVSFVVKLFRTHFTFVGLVTGMLGEMFLKKNKKWLWFTGSTKWNNLTNDRVHQPEIPLNAGIFMRHTFQKKKVSSMDNKRLKKGNLFFAKTIQSCSRGTSNNYFQDLNVSYFNFRNSFIICEHKRQIILRILESWSCQLVWRISISKCPGLVSIVWDWQKYLTFVLK